LSRLREGLRSWRVIWLSGAVYLASQIAIASILHPLDPLVVLELQTSLSSEAVAAILQQWRELELIDGYWRHYWLDFVHPLWYGVFLAALLARGFEANQLAPRYDTLILLPFVAAGFDLLENTLHVVFLLDEASITPAAVAISGSAAIAKWLLAALCLAAAITLGVRSRTRNGGIR